jgi:hypothetical protein
MQKRGQQPSSRGPRDRIYLIGDHSTYDVAEKVELIGPTLMLEYVTDAPGDWDSTSAGTPEEVAHVPRAAPGPVFVVG